MPHDGAIHSGGQNNACQDCGGAHGAHGLDGKQLSEAELSAMGEEVGIGDFDTWMSENLQRYKDAGAIDPNASDAEVRQAMLDAYEGAIAVNAFPELANMSDEQRDQLLGQLFQAAQNNDTAKIEEISEQLGGGNGLTTGQIQDLVLSAAGNHDHAGQQDDFIHAVTDGSKLGASENNPLFTLAHLFHMGDNGLAGRGADENGAQAGINEGIKFVLENEMA
jgi:hypothetical protein